jgi:hypothetical protein
VFVSTVFKRSFRSLKSSGVLPGFAVALMLEIKSTAEILFRFADQFDFSAQSALQGAFKARRILGGG